MSIIRGWTKAERKVFDTLLNAVGGQEGKNAYIGTIPDEMVNVWALNTGGGTADQAQAGCYGTEVLNASLTGVFTERESAQEFCGLVKGKLSQTNNMHNLDNIQWFRPLSNPTITQDLDAQVTTLDWQFEIIFSNV